MSQMTLNQKTTLPKVGKINRKWYLVDANDLVLGRLSTGLADLLTGKGKNIYASNVDCGDFVVAVNAAKVRLTGKKLEQKVDYHHSGRPGGGRSMPYKKLMQDRPEYALLRSVKRMLPKNKLASRQILRLKIYRGNSHPHLSQNLEKVAISA